MAFLLPFETRLRAGRLMVLDLFDDVRVLAVAEEEVARHRAPEIVFMNVNTPEDLERSRALLASLEPGGSAAGSR